MAFLRLILLVLRGRFSVLFAWLSKLSLSLAAYRSFRWLVKASVLAAFVLWLPLPGWLASLPARISAMPGGVAYLLDLVEFSAGLAIILGALVTRFLARLVIESMRD